MSHSQVVAFNSTLMETVDKTFTHIISLFEAMNASVLFSKALTFLFISSGRTYDCLNKCFSIGERTYSS